MLKIVTTTLRNKHLSHFRLRPTIATFVFRLGSVSCRLHAPASALRTARARRYVLGDDEAAKITISPGIATAPMHGTTADSLFKAADKALYQAKELGRNRVCAASSPERLPQN